MTVESEIYRAIVGDLEDREHNRTLLGNGHHLAQSLAAKAKEALEKAYVITEKLVMPACPNCKKNTNVAAVHRPEVYEFSYVCTICDMGFNNE